MKLYVSPNSRRWRSVAEIHRPVNPLFFLELAMKSPYADRRPARNAGAFTLVELLVVIGIIALLISILLPALGRARASANSVACLSNMRQLGQSLLFFQNEHDGYNPKAWLNGGPRSPYMPDFDTTWGYNDKFWGWEHTMLDQMRGSQKVFKCPADDSSIIRYNDPNGFNDTAMPAYPALWDQKYDQDNIAGSYRLNISDQGNAFDAIKATQLKPASESIVFCEGAASGFNQLATWDGPPGGGESEIWPKLEDNVGKNIDFNRHPNQRLNYTFADGHAESLAWADTWRPRGPQVDVNGAKSYPTYWRHIFARPVPIRPDLHPPTLP